MELVDALLVVDPPVHVAIVGYFDMVGPGSSSLLSERFI